MELAEKLPGPTGYPIVGNAFDFLGNSQRKSNLGYVSSVALRPAGIKARSVYVVDSVSLFEVTS